MNALLILAAATVTVWAHRRWRDREGKPLRRMLIWLGAAAAIQSGLLHLAGREGLGPAMPALVALAAAAGLVTWLAISHLIARRTRRRDLILRIPLLGGAALGLALGSWVAAFICATLGTMRFGWKSEFRTARLFQLGLGSLALGSVLLMSFQSYGWIGDVEGLPQPLAKFALATSATAAGYALLGAVVLFGAFVRDPSLGIRRVSWRLALSHLLVVLVPMALVAAMWMSTTVLGVNQERARVAARALTEEADRLGAALDASLEGAEPESRWSTARSLVSEWPGLRLWRFDATRWERIAGDSIPGERELAGWADSLDRLPSRSPVILRGAIYLGAISRGHGRSAIALAPVEPHLGGLQRVADAGIRLTATHTSNMNVTVFDPEEENAPLGSPAPIVPESTAVEGARRLGPPDSVVRAGDDRPSGPARLRLKTPRVRGQITTPTDTFTVDRRDSVSLLVRGYVLTSAVAHTRRGWGRDSILVSAAATPQRVLSGLFELSSENPIGYIPLILLGLMAAIFLLIALWDVVMVTNMGRSITGAIGALRVAAAKLQGGDLSHRIEVKGRDDLWDVADAFNAAVAGLARAREIEKAQDRIENELQVARRIQERLLPSTAPRVNGLEIAGYYDPAREVGGDYFDHVVVDDRRVLLAIADVSGKSVPAALIMSGFRAALMSQDLGRVEPAPLAARLNQLLHESLDPGKFVTAFLGFLDGETGRLVYVNAGHNPPALLRRDGSHEWLEQGGTILGILPASAYEQGEATLGPGDLVALYTDGVTEGAAATGEQWGDARLLAALRRDASQTMAQLARGIADDVRAFEGEQGATDDITLVMARRLG